VSDLAGGSLDAYVDKLTQMGLEVGRTGSEMVEAATNFRKNGFGDEESANLARISALLQNVADEEISAGEATDFIISQIKGFNIAAEDSIHIVDAVNQVANEYSLSSGDLIKNLGTVSAALSVGGNEFEQVLGLMVSGTEIMRQSNKVARSNK